MAMARIFGEKRLPQDQEHKSKASPPPQHKSSALAADEAGSKRRSTFSKLRESLRLFGKSKSSPEQKSPDVVKDRSSTRLEDAPRFSCGGIADFKLKEPPRRSLDSRIFLGSADPADDPPCYEPPRRSFDVGMLARARGGRENPQERPNVVARLMGLSDLHLDTQEQPQCCSRLEELFKYELACKEDKEARNHTTEGAAARRSVPLTARNSPPEKDMHCKSQNPPKTTQDIISPQVERSKSLLLQRQQASFQRVVKRLERLQLSESQRQSWRAQPRDGDTTQQQSDEEEWQQSTPGDSNSRGQKSLLEELLKLEQLRAGPRGQLLPLARRRKSNQVSHHHQEISRKDDNKSARSKAATKLSIVVLETTQAARRNGSMQVDAAAGDKKPSHSPAAARARTGGSIGMAAASMRSSARHRSSRIFPPAANAAAARERDHTGVAARSSLMRPTIASAIRQRHDEDRMRPAPRAPKPRGDLGEWKPRRDESESRAALLNLRDNEKKKKKVASSRGGDVIDRVERKNSDYHEKSFREYSPGGSGTQTAASPKVDHCSSEPSADDAFENLSPVSVLDVASQHEYDDEEHQRGFKPSAAQVRNVEPDKLLATLNMHSNLQQQNDQEQAAPQLSAERRDLATLKVFNTGTPFSCTVSDAHGPFHACVEHWSAQQPQPCAKCVAQLCAQVDAAIFDDLVYDSIIHLNAQHIKKRMSL